MIVVKLIGGLGNQLFQYAAGRALADHHKTDLYLDRSYLDKDSGGAYTQRHYDLGAFNIKAKTATEQELRNFNFGSHRLIVKLKSFFPSVFNKLIFNESQAEFDPRFFKLPASTYLNGYWQDETYFLKIRDQLLKEITLVGETEIYKQLMQEISSSSSVSIHVRHGDYATFPAAAKFHGMPAPDYYKKAISYFEKEYGTLHYFIFSDDIAWCEQQFDFLKTKTVVSHSTELGAQQELMLMSKCKHNIIANSSFSWWAAWLNDHPDKKVIAPGYWFTGKKTRELSIIPKDWIVIE